MAMSIKWVCCFLWTLNHLAIHTRTKSLTLFFSSSGYMAQYRSNSWHLNWERHHKSTLIVDIVLDQCVDDYLEKTDLHFTSKKKKSPNQLNWFFRSLLGWLRLLLNANLYRRPQYSSHKNSASTNWKFWNKIETNRREMHHHFEFESVSSALRDLGGGL